MLFYPFIMRLFRLFSLYYKCSDNEDREIVRYEINQLISTTKVEDIKTIPEDVKVQIGNLFKQYNKLHKSDDLIGKTEAEEEIRDILNELTKLLK